MTKTSSHDCVVFVGKNPQLLTMSFFTNDHNYSCFDALELNKNISINSKHEVEEKKDSH